MRLNWATFRPYVAIVLGLGAITAVLAPMTQESQKGAVTLLYLLATLLAAARWGYAAGIASGLLANLLVNFFFVRPLHRLAVAEPAHLVELAIFLAVASVGALMLSRLREQAARARAHQADTEFLLGVSQGVANAATPRHALDRLCEAAARTVGARGCALLVGQPIAIGGATVDERSNQLPTRDELAVALDAAARGRPGWMAGSQPVTFVPLPRSGAVLRLLGRVPEDASRSARFEGVVNEIATAMDRSRLTAEAARAAELGKADAFKSVLLSSASHDLRTPLTAIKAAVSSLRDESVEWSEQDSEAFLETIESQTDLLSSTLQNLLEVSRLEGGAAHALFEPIEVAPLLAEAALATRGVTRGRAVEQRAGEGLWVRADYGLLMQALKNVIENAAKYSAAGAPVRLEAAEAPGRVVISVVDGGPAIPEADIPRLFDKFFRGRTSAGAKGSGLGLALVKAIVEMANGTVAARTNGVGNEITLTLPRVAPPV